MPGITDTSTAPDVYLGQTNLSGILHLDPGTGVAQYVYATTVETHEVRGLSEAAAKQAALYWSAQANTTAIVQRASDAGTYNVVVTELTQSLTPDT